MSEIIRKNRAAVTAALAAKYLTAATLPSDTLPITNYPVPSGAIIVSPTGNDNTGSGTLAAPYKTVQKAVDSAPVGGTVVLRGGTYREALNGSSKRLTMQAYPLESPWLKGSLVRTGWVQDTTSLPGRIFWRLDGPLPALNRSSAYAKRTRLHHWKMEDAAANPGAAGTNIDTTVVTGTGTGIDPWVVVTGDTYPAAHLPDGIYIDGVPQRQTGDPLFTLAANLALLRPGMFWVDEANSRIFLGSDPTGKTVEVTQYPQAMVLYASASGPNTGASGFICRGVGYAHYGSTADPYSTPGAVQAQVDGTTWESCAFSMNSGGGLNIIGSAQDPAINTTVVRCVMLDNGNSGFSGYYSNGVAVEDNILARNNAHHFSPFGAYGAAAGCKMTFTSAPVFRRNTFAATPTAPGLWFDGQCADMVVSSNRVIGNGLHGLICEISHTGTVVNNTFQDNLGAGVHVDGTDAVEIVNNTFLNNVMHIELADDDRYDSALPGNKDTNGIVIANNAFGATSGGGPAIEARDYSGDVRPSRNSTAFISALNNNAYHQAAGSTLVRTWSARPSGGGDQVPTAHTTLATLQGAGYEAQGRLSAAVLNPYVMSQSGQEIAGPSPAAAAGQAVSSLALAELGGMSRLPVGASPRAALLPSSPRTRT